MRNHDTTQDLHDLLCSFCGSLELSACSVVAECWHEPCKQIGYGTHQGNSGNRMAGDVSGYRVRYTNTRAVAATVEG